MSQKVDLHVQVVCDRDLQARSGGSVGGASSRCKREDAAAVYLPANSKVKRERSH